MSKPNRASRKPTAQPTEFQPSEGDHAYLWYFRNDGAINRLLAMVINKVDKLPWSRLAAVLALSLGIQPGVELVDRAARRLSSPEQHAAANEEPTNEAHLTSVCLPARASPVASQPRGKQTSRPVRTGTSKECRRREAVLNSAARDTSQQGRDPGGRP